MINYVLDLVASMRPLWSYGLNHVFALLFIATVPCVLRYLVLERD